MSNSGKFMGERFVRLLPVPTAEMEEQVRMGTLAIPGNFEKNIMRSKIYNQKQQYQSQRQQHDFTYMGAYSRSFLVAPLSSAFVPTALLPQPGSSGGGALYPPTNPSHPPNHHRVANEQQQLLRMPHQW